MIISNHVKTRFISLLLLLSFVYAFINSSFSWSVGEKWKANTMEKHESWLTIISHVETKANRSNRQKTNELRNVNKLYHCVFFYSHRDSKRALSQILIYLLSSNNNNNNKTNL